MTGFSTSSRTKVVRAKETRTSRRRLNVLTAQKVILQVERRLLDRADQVATELQFNRSRFFRAAVQEKIERFEKDRLDAELREGYQAMSELRLREHRDLEGLTSDMLATERTDSSNVG